MGHYAIGRRKWRRAARLLAWASLATLSSVASAALLPVPPFLASILVSTVQVTLLRRPSETSDRRRTGHGVDAVHATGRPRARYNWENKRRCKLGFVSTTASRTTRGAGGRRRLSHAQMHPTPGSTSCDSDDFGRRLARPFRHRGRFEHRGDGHPGPTGDTTTGLTGRTLIGLWAADGGSATFTGGLIATFGASAAAVLAEATEGPSGGSVDAQRNHDPYVQR